ncbi:hypothetical protein Nepgr_003148 [Nepenthes gracilis]|uniref:Calmodulin-binding protein 60 A-like n=1 Tax=Nepenthes gracilis TaxID=150966 RepID=A0AAD3RZ25_NEPGR|nr:hypothetical protein Nepgr_003148 [Nepenthes gracilis]
MLFSSFPDIPTPLRLNDRYYFEYCCYYAEFRCCSRLWISEMSQKRHQDDDRNEGSSEAKDSPEDKRRKLTFGSVVQEAMLFRKLQHMLEPLVRKIVKEEVELALTKHVIDFKRNCGIDVFSSEPKCLQLKFINALSLPVFTGTRIEGEDGSAIKVAVVDALTDEIANSGPESSAKVEIVVLEGDFDSDEGESWTKEEFQNNIVKEREGKKPLLTGDVYLNLKDGVGFVGEVSFTDNSSWTRSRRFRLGARLSGNSDGARVKEAKTEPFIVRDHRGELYKKHYPPKLSDEVWRLEKIGKDGAFHKRLNKERVKTVKDFLIMLHLQPARLRDILGSGMSAKMWEATVEHARTCVLDTRVFLYCPPTSEPIKGVAFNEAGQVIGLLSGSQYSPVDKLSEIEKHDAHDLVVSASRNLGSVKAFDDRNSLLGFISNVTGACTLDPQKTDNSDGSKLLASEKNDRFNYVHQNVSSPDIPSSFYPLGRMSSSDNYGLEEIESLDLRFDQPLELSAQVPYSICDTESMARAFCDDGHPGFLDTASSTQSPNTMLECIPNFHSPVSGFSQPCFAPTAARGAQRRWKLIFSVLQWFFIMRIVVRRARGKMREILSLPQQRH